MSEAHEERTSSSVVAAAWSAAHVRALRQRRGENQQQFAERLGTRQQTVSEWERGSSHPRRMAQRLLTLLAEESPPYLATPDNDAGEGSPR